VPTSGLTALKQSAYNIITITSALKNENISKTPSFFQQSLKYSVMKFQQLVLRTN
jgi:hypothetical protein